MAAAAAPVPQFNSASIARYRGSAPINFRLILVNFLVLFGCAYVLLTALARYNTTLEDLDRVARTSAVDAKPCGLSVPRLKFIFETLKEIGDDAFAEGQESLYVERTRSAFCSTDSLNNALRSALQATDIVDDCCSQYPDGDARKQTEWQLDNSVKDYVCTCAGERCGHGHGDMLRRIQHAYVLAAPGFAVYVDSNREGNTCAGANDPFSSTSCATSDASITTAIHIQLVEAADNSFKILAGQTNETAPWPTPTKMLYRLLALSIIEYYDRKLNNGGCFANSPADTAVQFCTTILAPSMLRPDASSVRPLGDPWAGGCGNAAEQKYYAERIANSDSCTFTKSTDAPSTNTPLWTQRPRKFTAAYEANGTLPVYAICSSMLDFGLLDRKRLFGLPDPIGKFEWHGEHASSSFARWLGGIAYWSLFDANKYRSEVADKHSAYLDLKLFVAYRHAVTAAWVIASCIACGYLFAFACVPFAKLLYIRLVRRQLTNTRTDTILLKPTGSAEYIALLTTVIIGLWVIFVDPAGGTPYVVTSDCAGYERHGGGYATTAGRPRDGLLGIALILLGAGLLLYTLVCRRPPKRQRIMPLDPFPLWPIMALILVELSAVLMLMLRAGTDWWTRESGGIDGSNTKTTQDLEDIIRAAVWVLLCLGLLMGVLNQRHMAANVVLNVPRGRPVVFAYLWAAAAFALALGAMVFSWPLFDCQVAWTTNNLICGDGTDNTMQWNYFFGAIAFVACVVAAVFVFWAGFKVLFSVPRKNDPSAMAFNRSKDQEIAVLNKRKFGGGGAIATPGNPFGTGLSVATALSDSAVVDAVYSDDDYDVYGFESDAKPAEAGIEGGRVRFDLSGAYPRERSNVLAEAQLLPVIGTPVSASFCVDNEKAMLLPHRIIV